MKQASEFDRTKASAGFQEYEIADARKIFQAIILIFNLQCVGEYLI
jgi:hypothetical protein